MDAHELLARDGQQAERVVLAQVGLLGERQPREVVERADRLRRVDARGAQPLASGERAASSAADGRAQPLELQRAQLLARRAARSQLRSLAFQLRSRFSTSAGLRWQYACSRAYMAM